ncbi:hypothetical protein BZA77DRAFT_361018 [Pyronema omphalodes]|nr:hypothetical protein BZA77DRAFT_361018 [Pyronema omphalodes]
MQFTTIFSVLSLTAIAASSPVSPAPISSHPLLDKRASIGCSMRDLWAAPAGSMDGVINNLMNNNPDGQICTWNINARRDNTHGWVTAECDVNDGQHPAVWYHTWGTEHVCRSRREIGEMARRVYDACKQGDIVQGWIQDEARGETWVEIGRTPNGCKASS